MIDEKLLKQIRCYNEVTYLKFFPDSNLITSSLPSAKETEENSWDAIIN